MEVSKIDIKSRIETVLSDILSDKHDARIRIKFGHAREDYDGDYDTPRIIGEK